MIISGTMVTINASKPNTKAKSAPVHQVLYFEGPQLVDNSYLPLYLIVLLVLGPKMT